MTKNLKTIRLFDSAEGDKRDFQPQTPGKVKLYVCGVTVYDLTHIGHARVFIVFDVFYRFLRRLGYDVEYVRNHTDVDDKILKRAEERGVDPLELSAHFIEELDRDMGQLGIETPTAEPKVSEHIETIIAMNETLIGAGYAYEAGGDVYYRVQAFEDYGKLSGRSLDDMEAGRSGRVDDDGEGKKEHPFDFALWKASSDDQLGWDSPWGRGRPGWHIECSAMSTAMLGDTIDIHGGGRDLLFPHHENEIAQSEAATGQAPFVNYWMHVGMVNVAETDDEGEEIVRKMSKSLGNFWTTRDVLGGYHPEAVRYFMHTTVYRNPITYSMSNLDEATGRVEYLYRAVKKIDTTLQAAGYGSGRKPSPVGLAEELRDAVENFHNRFDDALADDLNTPRALALFGEVARQINEVVDKKGASPTPALAYSLMTLRQHLTDAGEVLGLLQRDPTAFLEELQQLKLESREMEASDIEALIEERKEARANQDWERADAIRDQLDEMDVEIMDSPEGTTWRLN